LTPTADDRAPSPHDYDHPSITLIYTSPFLIRPRRFHRKSRRQHTHTYQIGAWLPARPALPPRHYYIWPFRFISRISCLVLGRYLCCTWKRMWLLAAGLDAGRQVGAKWPPTHQIKTRQGRDRFSTPFKFLLASKARHDESPGGLGKVDSRPLAHWWAILRSTCCRCPMGLPGLGVSACLVSRVIVCLCLGVCAHFPRIVGMQPLSSCPLPLGPRRNPIVRIV
jgi:hypothetical protein